MNGIEWIVEAHGCVSESLSDLKTLCALFERIVDELQLRSVGETQWHQFPQTGGITGLCLLAESHLAVHTFPEFQSLCLNLFCCVPRREWDFGGRLRQMFGAHSVTVQSVPRPYGTLVNSSEKQPQTLNESVISGSTSQ
jgi:S-adenosylmethionine decarboxylase